ncbi:MAG: pseudouridine synthase [Candidatus Mesenet longicola]|uniref:Pseudouridine synthase n=1 Tax=Candidatus Mesenet longicola TaxID=1892558 RepID=A0A8J3MP52_9RICK|nr:MAG: pseudouridine synthase [Candidatus Mesenet longicola]GHM59570.1 MAG: pseudouridine synthase [Candidatus Mesenet longicola]
MDILIDSNDVRIDRYIRRIIPNLKQSVIEKSLREGLIKVDGCKVKSSYRTKIGQSLIVENLDYVSYLNSDRKRNDKITNILQNNVLYEDEYIISINKPQGITVQGGTKVQISIDDLLDQIKVGEKFKLVHRLDRDTSGVLLLARNAEAASYLMQEFKNRRIKKIYLALTSGIPTQNSGFIDLPLVKKYVFGQEKVVVDENLGQSAITQFSVIKKWQSKVAYLKLKPLTGRTHQLRVHMSYIKCPIVGDGKYGGKSAFIAGIANKVHLHAHSISFKLPSNKTITITAPVPEYLENSIKYLG